MAFKFHEASCVALGTFNIYVFQPPLFVHAGLVKTGEIAKYEHDLSQPGCRLTFDSPAKWIIRPDRLVASTQSSSADCGTQMAAIIEMLPWTPITAVGINFDFQASEQDLANSNCLQLLPHVTCSSQIRQRSTHIAINEHPHILNFQLHTNDDGVTLSCNTHTDVNLAANPDGRATRLEVSAYAANVARNWDHLKRRTVVLAKELFNVELDYGH